MRAFEHVTVGPFMSVEEDTNAPSGDDVRHDDHGARCERGVVPDERGWALDRCPRRGAALVGVAVESA